jgi:hypothetical protein
MGPARNRADLSAIDGHEDGRSMTVDAHAHDRGTCWKVAEAEESAPLGPSLWSAERRRHLAFEEPFGEAVLRPTRHVGRGPSSEAIEDEGRRHSHGAGREHRDTPGSGR